MAESETSHAAEFPKRRKKYLRTVFLPNSTPVPNWVFDELVPDKEVPDALIRVLIFLIRKTVGWNNRAEELSLTEIQHGAAITRPTAIHAIRVICDCWNLFEKTRGRKGQHSSVYAVTPDHLSAEHFGNRLILMWDVFDKTFPSAAELRPMLEIAAETGKPLREVIERIGAQKAAESARREAAAR